jgi:hypothetical protein
MAVIACCFAGREARMRVQLHYMLRLLESGVVDRYDVWNFAWSKSDAAFVDSLTSWHPQINVRRANVPTSAKDTGRGGNLAVQQIGYFYAEGYSAEEHRDDVFLKVDDDVVWLDHARMSEFIALRRENPEPFLISAEVINRDFWAKRLRGLLRHGKFLLHTRHCPRPLRLEAVPSSQRLSINFCTWLGSDLPWIIDSFRRRSTGNEDEIQLCSHIPRFLGRENAVVRGFHAAHLSFGGQEPMPNFVFNHYLRLAK